MFLVVYSLLKNAFVVAMVWYSDTLVVVMVLWHTKCIAVPPNICRAKAARQMVTGIRPGCDKDGLISGSYRGWEALSCVFHGEDLGDAQVEASSGATWLPCCVRYPKPSAIGS